jgi:hypothetical protein
MAMFVAAVLVPAPPLSEISARIFPLSASVALHTTVSLLVVFSPRSARIRRKSPYGTNPSRKYWPATVKSCQTARKLAADHRRRSA